jgi:hypothetical protein
MSLLLGQTPNQNRLSAALREPSAVVLIDGHLGLLAEPYQTQPNQQ